MAASLTLVLSGPIEHTENAFIGDPRQGTRAKVGFKPTTPQNVAGMRTEPPPSVPRATGHSPVRVDGDGDGEAQVEWGEKTRENQLKNL